MRTGRGRRESSRATGPSQGYFLSISGMTVGTTKPKKAEAEWGGETTADDSLISITRVEDEWDVRWVLQSVGRSIESALLCHAAHISSWVSTFLSCFLNRSVLSLVQCRVRRHLQGEAHDVTGFPGIERPYQTCIWLPPR